MEPTEFFNVAEVQLSYKPHFKAQERLQISSSKQAYEVLMNNWDKNLIKLLRTS